MILLFYLRCFDPHTSSSIGEMGDVFYFVLVYAFKEYKILVRMLIINFREIKCFLFNVIFCKTMRSKVRNLGRLFKGVVEHG